MVLVVLAVFGLAVLWTFMSAGFFLAIDRNALTTLSHTPVLTSEPPPAPPLEQREGLELEEPEAAANG